MNRKWLSPCSPLKAESVCPPLQGPASLYSWEKYSAQTQNLTVTITNLEFTGNLAASLVHNKLLLAVVKVRFVELLVVLELV